MNSHLEYIVKNKDCIDKSMNWFILNCNGIIYSSYLVYGHIFALYFYSFFLNIKVRLNNTLNKWKSSNLRNPLPIIACESNGTLHAHVAMTYLSCLFGCVLAGMMSAILWRCKYNESTLVLEGTNFNVCVKVFCDFTFYKIPFCRNKRHNV